MGLLDDAIREHLELKRRHGADPSEVERQEHEALGPARRGAAPAADMELDEGRGGVDTIDGDDPAAGSLYDDEYGYEDEEEPLAASEPLAGSESGAAPEAPIAPPAAADRDDRPERAPAESAQVVEDLEPVDPADLEPPPAPDPRVTREPGATGDEPPAGEDVLEETPEFLQETPEHDRLWFEQKPPRDFEF